MADEINKYLDEEKPWVKIKNDDERLLVQKICTDGLNLFKILITYLKPVLPEIAAKVEQILKSKPLDWANIEDILLSRDINEFKPLIMRIDSKAIEAMKQESIGED